LILDEDILAVPQEAWHQGDFYYFAIDRFMAIRPLVLWAIDGKFISSGKA
jgi:hypothetical protein